ncbi:MAG: pitrilysin family protein [Polyangiaceae bacterium]
MNTPHARNPNDRCFRRLIVTPVALGALAMACAGRPAAPPSTQHAKGLTGPRKTEVRDPAAWRSVQPEARPPSDFSYPVPKLTQLRNGLRIYVVERQGGPLNLSVVVDHGASGESAMASGLASMTAALMAEATKRHNHRALSELAESLGSTLVGDANRDFVRLSIDTLPDNLTDGLTLLKESLTEPAFDTGDFERLRQRKLDELRAERQNPTRLASLVGLRLLFGPDLGNPVGGCPSSISKLKPSDPRNWHEHWVTPKTTAIFVVGPVQAETAIVQAERIFGSWKTKTPASRNVPTVAALPEGKAVYVLDRPESVQSAIFAVQQFPRRMTEGFIAREHLDNLLGGLFTSRINQNLREEHAYTYGARTMTVAAKDFGLFAVSTSVATDVTAPAMREILSELSAIRGRHPSKPISGDELSRSRADLVQTLGAHLENGHHVLADTEQLFVHDLPVDYYTNYPHAVSMVSADDVATESERLTPERMLFVIVGDAKKLQPELAAAGFTQLAAPNDCVDD